MLAMESKISVGTQVARLAVMYSHHSEEDCYATALKLLQLGLVCSFQVAIREVFLL
jgi:hypothetical protein